MTIQRMEHVGIVVDDLAAATESFVELGLVLQGEGSKGFSSANSPGGGHSPRSHSGPPMKRTNTIPRTKYVTNVITRKISAASSHRIAPNAKAVIARALDRAATGRG
jgi:hypothetical protein